MGWLLEGEAEAMTIVAAWASWSRLGRGNVVGAQDDEERGGSARCGFRLEGGVFANVEEGEGYERWRERDVC